MESHTNMFHRSQNKCILNSLLQIYKTTWPSRHTAKSSDVSLARAHANWRPETYLLITLRWIQPKARTAIPLHCYVTHILPASTLDPSFRETAWVEKRAQTFKYGQLTFLGGSPVLGDGDSYYPREKWLWGLGGKRSRTWDPQRASIFLLCFVFHFLYFCAV